MRQFKIVVEERYRREPGIVEFEAIEIGAALEMAASLVQASQAEMWCDGKLLCRLSRPSDCGPPFWQVC
ncbi:hypothetical protein Q9K01_10815 [Qipengyuania sp. DY56-A-20]|jgi:hypothetical protein|uniref:Uncharacterized protein n=1 Tax=Qipengyuania benthica TaxID=3067651 RepID=A0ABT9H9Y9_9SPHN|nr:hypothetical protein [Qipengyuania sp. DY56-A-20]MBU1252878.1 hypothetical protein [Alphaproteobacteria bacterium]MBU1607291.1 hypothetical protein [Alphaproteobacteria bacterium]MDP4540118.1 hypothetical protein [Qipengyuania sp. DY56-A-20]